MSMHQLMPGPCVVCGGTNYHLSMGGPTICPKCDCGIFDAGTVLAQAKVMERQREEIERLRTQKDSAYEERNKVVAALATLFPSGVARTAIPGWSDDWHGCVYIDLPTGQVSWHYHDSQAYLFAGLPPYTRGWDGHDTPEKYRRLAQFTTAERG